MDTSAFLSLLREHYTVDDREAAAQRLIDAFVCAHPQDWWKRGNQQGHVTASAFIVDADGANALLLHHAALDKWLQPGGHLDDADGTPLAGACRESEEETGLNGLQAVSERFFDLDVHPIPARRKNALDEPAHLHYDVRFMLRVGDHSLDNHVSVSDESHAFRWVPLSTLSGPNTEASIARMARKFLASQISKCPNP